MRNRLDLGGASAHSTPGSVASNLAFKTPLAERGAVDIGKVNVVLIGLIVVIFCGLLLKEEGNSGFSNQVMQLQTQVVSEAGLEQTSSPATQDTAAVEAMPEPITPAKPEQTLSSKKRKKVKEEQQIVELEPAASPVVETHTSVALPIAEPVPVPQKEPQRKMLVFNLWSVSELRLRRAYTTFMNDSTIPAHALEVRKKDYLNFVNRRTKKCGELDNKFAGNINTVEKLTFSKGDMDILECHTVENNAELDTLNAAYGAH